MLSRFHSFTLVELLAAIGIIAIVAGIVLGGMNFAVRRADEAKTLAIMAEFELALDAFKHDNGYFPPCAAVTDVRYKLNGTEVNIVFLNEEDDDDEATKGIKYSFENAQGRAYLEFGQVTAGLQSLKDAWGNPLKYQCPGDNNPESYDLWSTGPKTSTDADDIGNWQKH